MTRTWLGGLAMAAVAGMGLGSGANAQVAAQEATTQRRGLMGVSLSCEECVVLRGPGRAAYTRYPMFLSVTSNGPASQAGIQRGDTLISVDGLDVTTPEGLERLANLRVGVPARMVVRRGGSSREVTLTPTREDGRTGASYYTDRVRTAQRLGAEALRSSFRSPMGWLGVGVECEGCSISSLPRRQALTFRQLPAVVYVDVDGPAHRAGLRRGDTLTAIDGVDIATQAGGRAFSDVEPGQRVTLTVRRDGRSRQVPLVAVARPDASREELAAFAEYRRMRDSSESVYRQTLSATVARAQAEMVQLERLLREAEGQQRAASSAESRARIAALDSMLRALRELERQRSRNSPFASMPEYVYAITAPTPPVAPIAPGAPIAPAPLVFGGRAPGGYPLRFSERLGEVVNVETRALGPATLSMVGDSTMVVSISGYAEVKITLRCVVANLAERGRDTQCRRVVVPTQF